MFAAVAVAAAVLIPTALMFGNLDFCRNFYGRYLWTVLQRVEVRADERIQMRDGVRLAMDLYIPHSYEPPYPVIYIRTPYGKESNLHDARYFAREGYAVAVQDLRGRGKSEGESTIYGHVVEDGWDTLDWLAKQRWCNGKIGTYGCSALGEVQYMLAAAGHPNHRAMIVEAGGGAIGKAAGRYGFFGLFEGGILNLSAAVGWFSQFDSKSGRKNNQVVTPDLLWQLPVVDLLKKSGVHSKGYEDFVSHPPGDPWWDRFAYLQKAEGFSVPGLHVNSWYDLGVEDTITLALGKGVQHPAPQYVIISPTTHCKSAAVRATDTVGEMPVAGGDLPYFQLYLQWFAHWLKGEGPVPEWPRIRVFVLGANEWIDMDSWPPAPSETWYLTSTSGANSESGDGGLTRALPDEGADSFEYDPRNPVPTRGGPHCCTANPDDQPGAFDQSAIEKRRDVLVYDSNILDHSVTAIGPLRARLFVSTSAPDTDFTAKLVDVRPDGKAYNVQDGAFRLRYREGYETPLCAVPGDVYEIEIGLRATAYRFNPGHRIRVEISSSNFPRLARNLNTCGDSGLETNPVVSVNTVYHGGSRASCITLPVVPER